jgi:hypothetical protein
MKTAYLECICNDVEHITRLAADIPEPFDKEWDDLEFYFQYRIIRNPMVFGDWPKTRWSRVKNYLLGIWYAIKGVPNWYWAHAVYNADEAKKMADFVYATIEEDTKIRGNKK